MLRALIDPNMAPLRAEPREARDLAITAQNGWVLAFDNLSHLAPWLSDAFCRLSTGGGWVTRTFYTDADEMIFEAQRPLIVNGIEDIVTSSDLLERTIPITLPTIPEHARVSERVFWRNFRKVQPAILGALLDAVVRGLRDVGDVELDTLPRMADFAVWVTAASPSFGWLPGRFLDAYAGNRKEAHEITLDAAAIVHPLRGVEEFEGTATDLLTLLTEQVDDAAARRRDWPKSARALSGQLPAARSEPAGDRDRDHLRPRRQSSASANRA